MNDTVSQKSPLYSFGDKNAWKPIYREGNASTGDKFAAMAIDVEGLGVLVHTFTKLGGSVSEAMHFVPGARLENQYDHAGEVIARKIVAL